MNDLFFIPLLLTLVTGNNTHSNKIIQGEWMQLIDGKFVLSSSFNKRPTNSEYKFIDCEKNICHYQYRTWYSREKRGIEEKKDFVVFKVTDKLFCNSMEVSQVRFEQISLIPESGGLDRINAYTSERYSTRTFPLVKVNPLGYRLSPDLIPISDGKFAFNICKQNKPFLLNEYIKRTFIEGNRIARFENLFKTEANLKYRYFADNRCVKSKKEEIVNCITLRNIQKSRRDSLLVIDMDKKLMFVIGDSAGEPTCSRKELKIKIYYGNPDQPDTNNFQPEIFAKSFNSYVRNYLYIFGCKKDLKPKWFFTGYLYPKYSYDEMPWEGNLVETEKQKKNPLEEFYLRFLRKETE